MYENIEFDDDFDGLRVKLDDFTELRVCRKVWKAKDRIDLRIWRLSHNKLKNKIEFIPMKAGVFMEAGRFRDEILPYLNSMLD